MEETAQDQQEANSQEPTGIPAGAARAAGLVVKEEMWEVERTVRIDGVETTETVESVRIPVKPFIVPPEVVGLSYGITVNLGNFNSGRASVWRSRPCYTAEVDDCYTFISEWAGQKIKEQQADLLKLKERLTAAAGGGGSGGAKR